MLADGSSLVLAKLKHGDHEVKITGSNDTRGAWALRVFLAGDVNGDFAVDAADHDLINRALNDTITSPGFLPEADVDRDGRITGFDLAQASGNKRVSTSLRVLTVTAGLDPGHDTGVPGDNLVNLTSVSIIGQTRPGAQIELDTDGDGFDDGGTTAGSGGGYSLAAALTEGANTLRLRARDSFGQEAVAAVTVTVDPHVAAPAFDLSAGSDTGPRGDHVTEARRVTLVGQTEPGARVILLGTTFTALASKTGSFQFPNVPLTLGENLLTAQAIDAAGNVAETQLTIHLVEPTGQADPVLQWNRHALSAIARDASDPLTASRALAMVQSAVFDAVNAVEGNPGHFVTLAALAGASVQAAVAQAARDVLLHLFPAQQATFDAALASSLASVPDGQGETDGRSVGQSAAGAIIALRSGDGWNDLVDYFPGGEPGDWRPTAPVFVEALKPQWGSLMPWAVARPDQFLPPGPPDIASPEWAADLNEVKSLGAANSATRTADQTEVARFWTDGYGTYTPPGHWNEIAYQVALSQGNSLGENARLFAQLGVAMADAAIVAWNAKYLYDTWRPITAIREADTTGSPDVTADPNWLPLLVTPAFPEYVSGHSTFSGAAAGVLSTVFGTSVNFTVGSATVPGVTRSYGSFDEAAEEAGRSRIYGGIHFEFSNRDGLAAGRALASHVLATFDTAEDTIAPTVILAGPSPNTATAQNVTIQGRVLDNLSGATTLRVALDDGEFATLAFDVNGNFTLPTSFALDGSADGPHAFTFQATDFAGNVSGETTLTITLDTTAPVITVGGPVTGEALAAGARVFGAVDATGSSIVALSYAIDGGVAMPMIFDPSTGEFSEALALSKLAGGDHTIVVAAKDAAGNTAQTSVGFRLDAPLPLTVTSFTPLDTEGDVGVTFRPQVFFSRPIDLSTLNADTFFATDASGEPLPATIAPAADGSSAWLFFTSPLPGASTITVHMDGDTIRAPGGGELLDGDGDGAPGGELTWTFSTVSLAGIPGTSISGTLADPGLDLKPGTIDDVRRGPDGVLMTADDVYLNPLEHVKVYILGREDQVVYTDASGHFELHDIPAGHIKLVVDGLTAANAPDGIFYPEMVMALNIRPGEANTVMAAMQPTAAQAKAMTMTGAYLPRLQTSLLRTVSATETTTVTVDAASAPDLTDERRQYLTLEVQPNSILGADGQPLANPQIGISTVNSDFVRDMLPPEFRAQHQFEITIQAPGATVFTTPVRVSFPNLQSAPPGTKVNILSFDHTTGVVVPDGTGTVTEDGQYVVSDPGSGIKAPGWHFLVTGSINIDRMSNQSNPDRHYNRFPNVPSPRIGLVPPDRPGATWENVRAFMFETANDFQNRGFTVAAEHLRHFLDNTGTQVEHNDGSDASNKARSTLAHFFSNRRIQLAIVDELDRRLANGSTDTNVDLNLDALGAQIAFSNPFTDLYWAVKGTQGVRVTGSIEVIDGRYVGIIRYEYFDTYGFGRDDAGLSYQDKSGRALQLTGRAQPFRNRITVLEVMNKPANIPSVTSFGEIGNNATLSIASFFTSEPQISEVPGFGTDQRLYYRIALDNGLVVAGRTGVDGSFGDGLLLPANSFYHAIVYSPSTNRSGVINGFSGSSGATFGFEGGATTLYLDRFGGPDSDGDGIPNVGELAIGIDPDKADTDGDGVTDDAEITQGLDPLDDRGFPTGIVASLPLRGSAQEVVVEGNTAYVAADSGGLAVVDVSRFSRPVIAAQILLNGVATDVAALPELNLVAVATNSGGLRIVDVTTPAAPVVVRTVNINASRVEIADGFAFVASGNALVKVDLISGDILQTLDVSAPITDIAYEQSILYTMDAARRLRAFDLSTGSIVPRGALTLPSGGGKLFVGNGIAYAAHVHPELGGFATANVRNPGQLFLISGNDAPSGTAPSFAIESNGSGLGLLIGQGPRGPGSLRLLDVSDPTNTYDLILEIPLPDRPSGIAIASGIAFVADGSAGLQIINYLPFDNRGQAPTVAIDPTALDLEPTVPGVQVLEGSRVYLDATVSDDVQVRSVELLVNGRVVKTDSTFPWDLSLIVPEFTPESPRAVVQVRATDTGGNVTLSPEGVVDLLPDTTPPMILSLNPFDGSERPEGAQSFSIRFNEPITLTAPLANTFELIDSAGVAHPASSLILFNNDQQVNLTFAGLVKDDYWLVIHTSAISDSVGNAMAQGDVTTRLSLTYRSTLSTAAPDADPNMPGLQVYEGTTVPASALVAPDVAVRRVEFLVNGIVVASRTKAPFGFTFAAPNITGDLATATIQARVIDRNGFATLSNPITLGLLDDVTPPTVVSIVPDVTGTRLEGSGLVTVRFSEPLARSVLSGTPLRVINSSGVAQPIPAPVLADDDRELRFSYSNFVAGEYRLVFDTATVTDRAGNSLTVGPESPHFSLGARTVLAAGIDDADPDAPGPQVFVGSSLPLIVNVDPTVPVQVVEILANGVVVASGQAAPANFTVVVPGITPGVTTLTLAARVTDVFGFATLSNVITLGLVEDTTPPSVLSVDVGTAGAGTVTVHFSEPLAAAVLTADPVRFLDSSGVARTITNLALSDGGRALRFDYRGLAAGEYRIVLRAGTITDRAGNSLSTTDLTLPVTLVEPPPPPDTPLFADPVFEIGGPAGAVVLGDVNADGRTDLVVVNRSSTAPGVSVLIGKGNGSFLPATRFATGSNPVALALGDLNHDGVLDVVTANSFAGTASVLLGFGGGSFGVRTDYVFSGNVGAVALSDLDGDGNLDLVVANSAGGGIVFRRGLGDGSFGDATVVGGGLGATTLAVGDLDNDGDPDVVARIASGSVSLFRNLGAGTFATRVDLQLNGFGQGLTLGDIDRDGALDIVLGVSIAGGGNAVAVLPGFGDGTFGGQMNSPVQGAVVSGTLADVNGDGLPDLFGLIARFNVTQVVAIPGIGGGAFGPEFEIAGAVGGSFSLTFGAAGDIDGDGVADLVYSFGTAVAVAARVPDRLVETRSTFGVTRSPSFLAVGDFDLDGDLDVAAAGSYNPSSTAVSVLLGRGDGSVASRTDYPLPGRTFGMAVGDIDGDSDLDLLFAGYNFGGSKSLHVLLGRGDGTFTPGTGVTLTSSPSSIAVGDVDGDGRLDAVITNRSDQTVSVLRGRGDGTFGPETKLTVPGLDRNEGRVALGDVDGDGDLDAALAGRDATGVILLVNSGAGAFSVGPTLPVGNNPSSVALADFDGDGDLDIATANLNGGNVSILRNLGGGAFAARVDYQTQTGLGGLAPGDVDGDGDLDLVVTHSHNQGSGMVLLNAGDATFVGGQVFPVSSLALSSLSPALGDWNGDGRLDLLTVSINNDFVTVLHGLGGGTFGGNPDEYVLGESPLSAALADADLDGHLDLLALNSSGDNLTILPGQGDGSFLDRTPVRLPNGTQAVVVGQVGGDDAPGVVTANGFGDRVSIVYGDRSGFLAHTRPFTPRGSTSFAVVRDLDADGRADLVTGASISMGVSVFLGREDGSVVPRYEQALDGFLQDLDLADVNRDGLWDILAVRYGGTGLNGFLTVLLGRGDGAFGTPTHYDLGTDPNSLALGDLDGDDFVDVVVSRFSGAPAMLLSRGDGTFKPRVSIAGQTGGEGALADLDGDGALDFVLGSSSRSNLTILPGNGDATFGSPVSVALAGRTAALFATDLDGDGDIDLAVALYQASQFRVDKLAILSNTGNGFNFGSTDRNLGLTLDIVSVFEWVDTDGDGRNDLVVGGRPTGGFDNSFVVMPGLGGGEFGSARTLGLPPGTRHITFGQMTADGLPDLFAFGTGSLGALFGAVLFGRGGGQFGDVQNISVGNNPIAVALGDLDGDGFADVVTANADDNTISVLTGLGVGRMPTRLDVSVGTRPRSILVADLNRDGFLDVVTANENANTLSVLLGRGDGTFAPRLDLPSRANPVGLTAADLNGDGILDLVIANRGAASVSVLIGRGDGSFESPQDYAVGSSPQALALGDMDLDGLLDIVTVSGSGFITVLLGEEDGSFGTRSDYRAGVQPQSVSLGDIDEDGDLDVLISNKAGSNVTVLLNRRHSASPQTP